MTKIFLYESNVKIQQNIKRYFTSKGFRVDCFDDCQKAFKSIDDGYRCFMVQLSNQTPQYSLQLVKSIKYYYPKSPLFILYFENDLKENLIQEAYQLGCMDVLKRPFLIEELAAKILRYLNIRKDVVSIGNQCSFDFRTGILQCNKVEHFLSKKEKRLFTILYEKKGNLVSFETIKAMVWEGEYTTLTQTAS